MQQQLHLRLRYEPSPWEIHAVSERPRKVLILGSGGLSIGQAGEFDYSGSQVSVYSHIVLLHFVNSGLDINFLPSGHKGQ